MNPFEMVVMIVAIVTIGSILRSRSRHGHRLVHGSDDSDNSGETRALREEVAQLKERIKVLERIAVEKEDTLTRQIEQLRDR